jgi:hypothetical protein
MVVCGYSFGDKGVNRFICRWMAETPRSRIVLIDPAAARVQERARGAIAGQWAGWVRRNRAIAVPKPLSTVSWPEIATYL